MTHRWQTDLLEHLAYLALHVGSCLPCQRTLDSALVAIGPNEVPDKKIRGRVHRHSYKIRGYRWSDCIVPETMNVYPLEAHLNSTILYPWSSKSLSTEGTFFPQNFQSSGPFANGAPLFVLMSVPSFHLCRDGKSLGIFLCTKTYTSGESNPVSKHIHSHQIKSSNFLGRVGGEIPAKGGNIQKFDQQIEHGTNPEHAPTIMDSSKEHVDLS